MKAFLAVHPQVRKMVLSSETMQKISERLTIVDSGELIWISGYPEDTEVEILITGWGSPPIDDAALLAMPSVKAIFHLGGTVRDQIMSDIWSREIQLITAADVNNEMVAEFVVSMSMLALKGSLRASQKMIAGRLPGPVAGPGSYGQTIGLVSFGSIAQKVATRLSAWSSDILAWDPFATDRRFDDLQVRRATSLKEVFRQSSLVSVHAPLIPGETEGMIGRDLLASLPQDAVFINTARGALVDEAALIEVFASRPDLFAILDVTWPEPPAAESPLYDLQNVMLTGHTSGSVGTEARRLGNFITEQIIRFTEGKPVAGIVSAEEAKIRA